MNTVEWLQDQLERARVQNDDLRALLQDRKLQLEENGKLLQDALKRISELEDRVQKENIAEFMLGL